MMASIASEANGLAVSWLMRIVVVADMALSDCGDGEPWIEERCGIGGTIGCSEPEVRWGF